MVPAANLALARSAAADARSRWLEQSAQCDLGIKALVALSALPEAQVRALVRTGSAMQEAPALALGSLPAQTIAQRPDVFAAERDVYKAAALVAGAQAQRWPRLTINGSIGPAQFGIAGVDKNLTTWSLGPVSLMIPVFDAGQRQANIEAAQAYFESKVVLYQARVRGALGRRDQVCAHPARLGQGRAGAFGRLGRQLRHDRPGRAFGGGDCHQPAP
jgi:outer membrane protein TolC